MMANKIVLNSSLTSVCYSDIFVSKFFINFKWLTFKKMYLLHFKFSHFYGEASTLKHLLYC